jgi:hypothetical protein
MLEITLGIIGVLGILFITCKIINKIGRFCGLDEITDLIGESLSMRMGNFRQKEKEERY